MIKKKRKLILEFEDKENGIMVTTRVRGKLKVADISCAKQLIENKLKEYGKNRRK